MQKYKLPVKIDNTIDAIKQQSIFNSINYYIKPIENNAKFFQGSTMFKHNKNLATKHHQYHKIQCRTHNIKSLENLGGWIEESTLPEYYPNSSLESLEELRN